MASPAVFEFRLHPIDVATPRHNEIDVPDELAPARSHGFVRVVLERADRLAARLSRPPHEDLRGPKPIHVTRNVALSATEATEMLNRRRSIEWGAGRHSRQLRVGALHLDPTALGVPWVADALVGGRRDPILLTHGFDLRSQPGPMRGADPPCTPPAVGQPAATTMVGFDPRRRRPDHRRAARGRLPAASSTG